MAAQSLEARFWSKVEKSDGCWPWKGCNRGNGYGAIKVEGKSVSAHRVAYEMTYGPIPAGMDVCHHCDNPICVRPDHLFVGTRRDNMRDAAEKGRLTYIPVTVRGTQVGTSKLNDGKVREIRALYATGLYTMRQIAGEYDVDVVQVFRVVRRLSWTHVA